MQTEPGREVSKAERGKQCRQSPERREAKLREASNADRAKAERGKQCRQIW